MTFSNTWSGPSGGISSDSRITVGSVTVEELKFQSSLHFNSMKSSDTGTYTCSSIVRPTVVSLYVKSSDSTSSNTSVDAGNSNHTDYSTYDNFSIHLSIHTALKVTTEISYTPPDQYPDYEPPNYRAASSVSLRCVAVGATGSVSYRWSSTCSSCFASSSSSSSISESFLRSRDIGVHTCTATDSSGNTGSVSTEMNIVGKHNFI